MKVKKTRRLMSTAHEDLKEMPKLEEAEQAQIKLQGQQELDKELEAAERLRVQEFISAIQCIQDLKEPSQMVTSITKDSWDSPRIFIERMEFSVNPRHYPSTIICLGMATGSNRCSCLYIGGREPKMAEIAVAILQGSRFKERIHQDLREGHYEKKNLYYGFYYILLNEAKKNEEATQIERLLAEGLAKIRSQPIGTIILQQFENPFRTPLPA